MAIYYHAKKKIQKFNILKVYDINETKLITFGSEPLQHLTYKRQGQGNTKLWGDKEILWGSCRNKGGQKIYIS